MHCKILRRAPFLKLARGVKTLDFAGHKEKVYERKDWPLDRLHQYFKNDTLAMIGYGSQGEFCQTAANEVE